MAGEKKRSSFPQAINTAVLLLLLPHLPGRTMSALDRAAELSAKNREKHAAKLGTLDLAALATSSAPSASTSATASASAVAKRWVPDHERDTCQVSGCGYRFGGLMSSGKHHCRRCGEIFCEQHTQSRRLLDEAGEPSDKGRWQRVCPDCFVMGSEQTVGVVRSRMRDFTKLRTQELEQSEDTVATLANVRTKCREAVERGGTVRDAAKALMENSGELRAADGCEFCESEFGTLSNRPHNCRLCCRAMCGECSESTELDLEFAGRVRAFRGDSRGSFSGGITRVSGSSSRIRSESSRDANTTRPTYRLVQSLGYIRACPDCAEQGRRRHNRAEVKEAEQRVGMVYDPLRDCQEQLETAIPQLEELIWPLEVERDTAGSVSRQTARTVAADLAFIQSQVLGLFKRYAASTKLLSTLPTDSWRERTIVTGVAAHTREFYVSNWFAFKALQARLADVIPASELAAVERENRMQLLTATYALVYQLVSEVREFTNLWLPSKQRRLRQRLNPNVEQLRVDLQSAVEETGGDWHAHYEKLNTVVDTEMWSRSKQLLPMDSESVITRCEEIVYELTQYLQDRLALSSAEATYQSLEEIRAAFLEEVDLMAPVAEEHDGEYEPVFHGRDRQ